ncbi:Pex12 amino terminal region-domain-containing protein [Thamnocephalis sphaerospora]|uniref:RING-type E3 ubiquitin transferase (cysteine targeting) n=1 Tax=Thamnocephalis sphaerospora TaxID=78915 RepID=A0A4P9XG45_9FUNG|nr:Pex12 amino terminal region-domain-containing protein [Thamnocephalis sphaerospora]|eukprot:RKP04586.1 Pex12 amino terminal region-domain-containing protein [Thamnocephalis sphaerospora]
MASPSLPSPSAAKPGQFWRAAAEAAQEQTAQLRDALGQSSAVRTPLQVQRVCQLDASLLDDELNGTLLDHAHQAVSLFKGNLKDRYKPELVAVLEALLYGMALFGTDRPATYGSRLQNLHYRNEYAHSRFKGKWTSPGRHDHAPLVKSQAALFCLLQVGGRYAWNRGSRFVSTRGWADAPEASRSYASRCWVWMQRVERVARVLTLANLIVFLYNGRYRTPLERLLGMRLVYASRQSSRAVSFEFLNRQLVWHAFTEFLLFLMPLVNLDRLRNSIRRRLTRADSGLAQLPPHLCAICHQEQDGSRGAQVLGTQAQLPYETSCGHLYCYYCIRSRLMADPTYPCPRCNERITWVRRVVDKPTTADQTPAVDTTDAKSPTPRTPAAN